MRAARVTNNDDHSDITDRFRRGDLTAFAELYDRFALRLYRVAWRMLGNYGAAEDAVQEVFLALLKVGARLEKVEDVPAYLFCCLRRVVGRLRSQHERYQRLEHLAQRGPENIALPLGSNGTIWSERVLQALRRLPPEQEEVVILKIEGELTFAEISMVLGISANTAASRYRYALDKLREDLGAERE